MEGEAILRSHATISGRRYSNLQLNVGEVTRVPVSLEDTNGVEIDIGLPQTVLGIARVSIENDFLAIEGLAAGHTVLTVLASTPEDGISGDAYDDLPTTIEIEVL